MTTPRTTPKKTGVRLETILKVYFPFLLLPELPTAPHQIRVKRIEPPKPSG